MTTTQLHRLNRNLAILHRYQSGDTVQGIAQTYSLHRNQVHRIVAKPSAKLLAAAQAYKQSLEDDPQ